MDPWLLYFTLRIDDFRGLIFLGIIALTMLVLFLMLTWLFNVGLDNEKAGKGKKFFVRFTPWVFLLALLYVLIPTQKDILAIVTVPYVLEAAKTITENKEVKELPENVLKLVNTLVKDWTPKEKK